MDEPPPDWPPPPLLPPPPPENAGFSQSSQFALQWSKLPRVQRNALRVIAALAVLAVVYTSAVRLFI
jgi:hypothetical protein